MLNQAQATTQSLSLLASVSSVAASASVVRSVSESRAFVILQSLLIKGTNEKYLSHPTFHQAFEDGYDYSTDSGDFGDVGDKEEVALDTVLDLLEQHLSLNVLQWENAQTARYGIEPIVYAQRIGFLRWLFDADRAPYIPLSLLQKWYSIEYLTRSVAGRFVAAHE